MMLVTGNSHHSPNTATVPIAANVILRFGSGGSKNTLPLLMMTPIITGAGTSMKANGRPCSTWCSG